MSPTFCRTKTEYYKFMSANFPFSMPMNAFDRIFMSWAFYDNSIFKLELGKSHKTSITDVLEVCGCYIHLNQGIILHIVIGLLLSQQSV